MQKRSRKHLGSEFQSRLIGLILIASGMGSIVSTCCAAWWFSRVAGELPSDGHELLSRLPQGLMLVCAGSLVATLPLFLFMARNATFRVFGPLHRFTEFLREVSAGTRTEPCALREGDEFQAFLELINEVSEPGRERNRAGARDRAA